jgi:hypothetical protein
VAQLYTVGQLYGTAVTLQDGNVRLAELRVAGREMTQRHLQRLRQAYREEGLIGLAAGVALASR